MDPDSLFDTPNCLRARFHPALGIDAVANQADPSYLQVVNELNGEISLDVGDPSEQPELRFIPNPNLSKAKKLLGKIEATLRELPVERPPKTDIYKLDIGIQFQKGDELVWDNVPTGDGGAGGGGSGGAIEPTRQEKAKFLKVLGDVVTLIAISSERGIFMIGNEGQGASLGGGKA